MTSALSELRALVETDTLSPETVLTPDSAKALRKKKASIGPYDFKPDAMKSPLFYAETSKEALEVQATLPGTLMVVGAVGSKQVYALVTKDRQFVTKSMLEATAPWMELSTEVLTTSLFSAQEMTQVLPTQYQAKEVRHVIEAIRQLGMAMRDNDFGAVQQAFEHALRVSTLTLPDNEEIAKLLDKVGKAVDAVVEE